MYIGTYANLDFYTKTYTDISIAPNHTQHAPYMFHKEYI